MRLDKVSQLLVEVDGLERRALRRLLQARGGEEGLGRGVQRVDWAQLEILGLQEGTWNQTQCFTCIYMHDGTINLTKTASYLIHIIFHLHVLHLYKGNSDNSL